MTDEAPHREARDRALFTTGECEPVVSFEVAELEAKAGANFLMVDDVTPSLMPSNSAAAAYYVGGIYGESASYAKVRAQCPGARLAPTMLRAFSGSLKSLAEWEHGVSWDCEPSLFTAAQAGGLVKMTRGQGVFPHLYCPLSWAGAVCQSVKSAGFSYNDFGLHAAHWTGVPHICGGIATVFGTVSAKSTQFTDTYLGRSLDCSLCSPGYLGPFGGPPAPTFPLKQGAQGAQVRQLQSALRAREIWVNVDGKYGPATTKGVKDWEHSAKRHVDGEVSHDDWDNLFPTIHEGSGHDWPGATQALKTALDHHGYHLKVDTNFDAATRGAVEQFQHQHNLHSDGIVGPQTWHSLFS